MGGASTFLPHVSEISFPIQKRIEFGRLGELGHPRALQQINDDVTTCSYGGEAALDCIYLLNSVS
jgi:hypothetical protein